MQGLNLHNTVADALAVINPWQDLTFKKTVTEWTKNARTPTVTETEISLKGKIQPADLQTVAKLGFDVNAYQYFTVFISADVTQIDRLRQLGADVFTTENGDKYQLVAKSDWIQNGWRQGYAYLIEAGAKDETV